ncbi:MAG: transposase [Methylococcaceae bacterium]|nr:transposase [Methylococcaceae bacterium]
MISRNFQPKSIRGRSREHVQKDRVNTILYVLKGGITWRMSQMTFLPGKPFMIILAAGANVAYGN